VLAITDSNGDFAEKYTYLPFGDATIYNENSVEISSSAISNPYMFTGRRFDEESDKYYYRFRTYDSNCGQFMQRDPLGYIDGMNLYEYVSSNPTSYIDPFGTKDFKDGQPKAGKWVEFDEKMDPYFNCFAWALGITTNLSPKSMALVGASSQILLDSDSNEARVCYS